MQKMFIDCSFNGSGCKVTVAVVVSYLGDKRNSVYKMCIHRYSNCSKCRISIEVDAGYSVDKRNGVYKMCIHRSSNWDSYQISKEVVVSYSDDKRNICTKYVNIAPSTVVVADFLVVEVSYSGNERNCVYEMCIHRSSNCASC